MNENAVQWSSFSARAKPVLARALNGEAEGNPMENEPERPSRSRENMLAISLVMIVGGIILFYLDLITLGIVVNVLAAGGLFLLAALLHYYAWGRSFSAEVAAERETLRRQDEQEMHPKMRTPPGAIQDISRTQGIQEK